MKPALKRFISSPLLHFLLVGLIIFLSSYYVTRRREAHRIIIDKAVVDKLIISWQTQFGKMPTDRELKIATDDYIRQEVLYREAASTKQRRLQKSVLRLEHLLPQNFRCVIFLSR
jgi:hypothetical protein